VKTNLRRILFLAISLVLLLSMTTLSGSVSAQGSDSVYVPETGHWIRGEFLKEYNNVSDPLLYFGYPITDDFKDSVTGQQVQYFQKARFDLTDTSAGPQVKLAPLGSLLHDDSDPLAGIADDGPTCRRFSNGIAVCYAFLQFYDAYNGTAYFGLPVSKLEIIDGRYIQYFENARMEWWPERSAGERVVLTDLGRVYFDKVVANPELLKANLSANAPGKLANPVVRVFAQKALIGAGDQQTVDIVVQNQYLQPMQGAQVGLTVTLPDGTSQFYRLSETNEYGVSQVQLTVPNLEAQSVVQLKADISINGEEAAGNGWFRVWW
jgi:hypothetical protein